MNDTLNNQLAQVCNNLFCIIQDARHIRLIGPISSHLQALHKDLKTEYNKLFKLIYGDK